MKWAHVNIAYWNQRKWYLDVAVDERGGGEGVQVAEALGGACAGIYKYIIEKKKFEKKMFEKKKWYFFFKVAEQRSIWASVKGSVPLSHESFFISIIYILYIVFIDIWHTMWSIKAKPKRFSIFFWENKKIL